jgi:hypothetical protein
MSQGGQQSSVTNSLPEWYSNSAQGYLQRQGEISGQDYTPYGGQRVADLSPTTQAGIQGIQDMAYGHPMGNDAVDMTRNTLQGNYSNPYAGMSGGSQVGTQRNTMMGPTPNVNVGSQRNQFQGENPYFMQQLQRGTEKITDAYNKGTAADTTRMFNMAGAFGGSAHQDVMKDNQEVLGEQLGDFTNNMLSGQYDRSAGLEESFLGRDFAGQQFNQGNNAMYQDRFNDRAFQGEENYLGRDFAGQQFNSTMGERGLDRDFSGWENERGRQMGSVGNATNLLNTHSNNLMNAVQAGGIEQNQYQRLLDSQYGDFNEWRDWEQRQNDAFGNALSRSAGGAGSTATTTGPGPDPMSQAFGGLSLASMLGRSGGSPK